MKASVKYVSRALHKDPRTGNTIFTMLKSTNTVVYFDKISTSSNDNDDSGGRIRRDLQTDGVWLFGSLTLIRGLLAVRALTKA